MSYATRTPQKEKKAMHNRIGPWSKFTRKWRNAAQRQQKRRQRRQARRINRARGQKLK